jgi:hypothetical protein
MTEELSRFPPSCLAQETSKSLEQLEALICQWVVKNGESFATDGCSALIALSVARGNLGSFLTTISILLKSADPTLKLPVQKVIRNLKSIEVQISKPCAIKGQNHVMTWPVDTDLQAVALSEEKELGTLNHPSLNFSTTTSDPANQSHPGGTNQQPQATSARVIKREIDDLPSRCFIASDGAHLYITGSKGKGVSKVGTGCQGSIRGWVYSRNINTNCGFISFTSCGLISRFY